MWSALSSCASKALIWSSLLRRRSPISVKLQILSSLRRAQYMASKSAASFSTSQRILHSWKEISTYVGRGIRTLQRYETELGFPIRRPSGRDRGSVFAFADEVDLWLTNAPGKSTFAPDDLDASEAERNLMRAQQALQKTYVAYRLALHRYNEAKYRSTFDGAISAGDRGWIPEAKWHWPAGVQFVKTELQVGTTMALIAKSTRERDDAERIRANARAAYETAARHVGDVSLSSENAAEFTKLFKVLRTHLVDLGEFVNPVSLAQALAS